MAAAHRPPDGCTATSRLSEPRVCSAVIHAKVWQGSGCPPSCMLLGQSLLSLSCSICSAPVRGYLMLGREVWVHPFLRGSWQLFAAIIDVCGLWWLSSKDCLQCRRMGSIPALGRSPGGGHGNPLQYFYLENPGAQRNLVGYSPWGCKRAGHD